MALSDELHALADRVFAELEHPAPAADVAEPQPAEPIAVEMNTQANLDTTTVTSTADAQPSPAEQVGAALERTFGPQDTAPPVPAGAEPAEPSTEGL